MNVDYGPWIFCVPVHYVNCGGGGGVNVDYGPACGDLNVAHQPLDLWGNHAANEKSAGYTPEERRGFGELLVAPPTRGGLGLVDTFRDLHPEAAAYSYWSYRGGARPKNRGWRIDYAGSSTHLSLVRSFVTVCS